MAEEGRGVRQEHSLALVGFGDVLPRVHVSAVALDPNRHIARLGQITTSSFRGGVVCELGRLDLATLRIGEPIRPKVAGHRVTIAVALRRSDMSKTQGVMATFSMNPIGAATIIGTAPRDYAGYVTIRRRSRAYKGRRSWTRGLRYGCHAELAW